MALYLPRERLAFEIVDDPCSAPVDREAFPDATVIPITCEQIADPDAMARVADAITARARASHGGIRKRHTSHRARAAVPAPASFTLVAQTGPTGDEAA